IRLILHLLLSAFAVAEIEHASDDAGDVAFAVELRTIRRADPALPFGAGHGVRSLSDGNGLALQHAGEDLFDRLLSEGRKDFAGAFSEDSFRTHAGEVFHEVIPHLTAHLPVVDNDALSGVAH